jgi:hypothetical protein
VRPPGTVDAYLIDEIGKMTCFCTQFITSMRALLDGPIPLVATVALRGAGFIAELRQRPDVRVVEVTHGIWRDLPGQIATWVKRCTAQANTPLRSLDSRRREGWWQSSRAVMEQESSPDENRSRWAGRSARC